MRIKKLTWGPQAVSEGSLNLFVVFGSGETQCSAGWGQK